jgi:hypothetical protein
MNEIPNIAPDDLETWHKVDAYLASQTYTAGDVSIDFTSVNFEEGGLHLTGIVDVFVPVNVYHKVEPPKPDPQVVLREISDLLEHHPDFYRGNSVIHYCALKAKAALT